MFKSVFVRGVCVAALFFVSTRASQGATIVIDDRENDKISVLFYNFEGGATVELSPLETSGFEEVNGSTLTFIGMWDLDGVPIGNSGGVIYFVDTRLSYLVRSRIEAVWWEQNGYGRIQLTYTTSNPGDDLGFLPYLSPFVTKDRVIPMAESLSDVQQSFSTTSTADLVSPPPGLRINFNSTVIAQCPHPTLESRPIDRALPTSFFADLESTAFSFEPADSVEFTEDVLVQSLRWWGRYAFNVGTTVPSDVDNFTLRIYEDIGGVPAPVPLHTIPMPTVIRMHDPPSGRFWDEFVYLHTLAEPVMLAANTRYWISILNDTPPTAGQSWLARPTAPVDGVRAFRSDALTGEWMTVFGPELALELCGMTLPGCFMDFNSDTVVDGMDLAHFLAAWGPCSQP